MNNETEPVEVFCERGKFRIVSYRENPDILFMSYKNSYECQIDIIDIVDLMYAVNRFVDMIDLKYDIKKQIK